MKRELRFKVDLPLFKEDSELQTHGCRHKDPEFCKHIDNKDLCAFVRKDEICKKPSTSWKRNYYSLKELEQKQSRL